MTDDIKKDRLTKRLTFSYLVNTKICPHGPNKILGKKCYSNLKSIKEKINMVDIFRSKEFIFDHTKEAIEVKADILWMQEGTIHEEAAELGRAAGMIVVMDECPKKILEN